MIELVILLYILDLIAYAIVDLDIKEKMPSWYRFLPTSGFYGLYLKHKRNGKEEN